MPRGDPAGAVTLASTAAVGQGRVMHPLICIDCRYIRERPSGIGEVVQALVDHVPAMAPDLRFLLLKHPAAPARLSRQDNVAERVVPYAANGPVTLWGLSRVVDLSEVALFHATYNILPAGLAMPTVTTIHDLMRLDHPEWANPGVWGKIEAAFYGNGVRRALRRSTGIAAVSEATRQAIRAHDPQAAARTTVTLSGVSADFRRLPAGEAALPASLRHLADRPIIVLVGQYAPYKNHDRALAAFAAIRAERPDAALVVVQRRGAGRDAFAARAAALGDAVHFAEGLDRTELIHLYNRATALLHPSLMEGFGMPLAEAMACGCPVITSDRSAMPEVTGGAALLVDPGNVGAIADALRRVLSDGELAAELSRRGLARARQLRWADFAEANLALYRRVLKPR